MTTIDELLARTRLLDEPVIPPDVVSHREGARNRSGEDSCARAAKPPSPRQQVSADATEDLQTLCEALVANDAVAALGEEFVAERLPAPRGARVMGCILQLSEAEDAARLWWQYAAGAGDDTASYCLYLHHLCLGEVEAAAWWRSQTLVDTRPSPVTARLPLAGLEQTSSPDTSTRTLLRVLRQLLSGEDHRRTEVFDAVMAYVPYAVAVGHRDDPDCEIPVPPREFAEHITIVLAAASAFGRSLARTPRRSTPEGERSELAPRDLGVSYWKELCSPGVDGAVKALHGVRTAGDPDAGCAA